MAKGVRRAEGAAPARARTALGGLATPGAALEVELEEIQRLGREAIPVVQFSEIERHGGRFPAAVAEAVRKRGVLVVRGVVGEGTARAWKAGVQE